MLNNILEVSKKISKGGRVPIKIALHKIHDDPNETNKNGIHWKLEYVKDVMESAKGIPICAEFIDQEEKEIPLGHGLTGSMINNDGLEEPVFLNSDTVGVIESVSIDEFKDDESNTYQMLVGSGYLFNQRYPKFVQWIRDNYATNTVETSIEIVGLPENDNKIIYEEENPTQDFRSPQKYLYSGCAVLSVEAADSDAIVLEISQKQNRKKEEQNMEFNMDEVKSVITKTITELNEKDAAHEKELQELNGKITELNEQLENKNSVITEKDGQISELNASVEQLRKAIKEMEEDRETWYRERDILEQELAKAKVAEKLAELDDAMGEFNEAEKEVAKEDIAELQKKIEECKKKEELCEVTSEINSIKSKICMAIVEKQKADEKEKAKISEQNSKEEKVDIEDIFAEMCSESVVDDEKEDLNIF